MEKKMKKTDQPLVDKTKTENKHHYVPPRIEVVEVEVESGILVSSYPTQPSKF